VSGVEHPDTLTAQNNLAVTLRQLEELEEARRLQREGRESFIGSFVGDRSDRPEPWDECSSYRLLEDCPVAQ
jgi:hypothetical protein